MADILPFPTTYRVRPRYPHLVTFGAEEETFGPPTPDHLKHEEPGIWDRTKQWAHEKKEAIKASIDQKIDAAKQSAHEMWENTKEVAASAVKSSVGFVDRALDWVKSMALWIGIGIVLAAVLVIKFL